MAYRMGHRLKIECRKKRRPARPFCEAEKDQRKLGSIGVETTCTRGLAALLFDDANDHTTDKDRAITEETKKGISWTGSEREKAQAIVSRGYCTVLSCTVLWAADFDCCTFNPKQHLAGRLGS